MYNVWQRTIVNESGDTLPNAEMDVFLAGTLTRATLYEDEAGVTPLTNPFNADVNGFAPFYTADNYYDVVANSGASTASWDDVQIGQPYDNTSSGLAAENMQDAVDAVHTLTTQGKANTVLAITDAITGGNISTTTPTANTTKLGDIVIFSCILGNIDTTGLTPTNILVIADLPYTANETFQLTVKADRFDFTGYLTAVISPGTNYLLINDTKSGLADANILVSAVASSGGSDLFISGVYTTDE